MIRIVESGTDRVDDIVMEILKALPHRWTQNDLRALRTILPREFAAARREAFEEAARIVGPDDALYAGDRKSVV